MRHKFIQNLHRLFKVVGLIAFIYLFHTFVLTKPSNDRNWETGQEKLTKVTIEGQKLEFKDIRDFKYSEGKITGFDYLNRSVDLNDLEKVWFIIEPFGDSGSGDFVAKGIAHTYFAFDFKDQPPLLLSVEARREKGEKYDAYVGAFNKFELIYIWSTETDQTIRRVILENNKLYMYPLTISKESQQQLLLHLATTTHELETTPRFYNTLLSNCTNELAKAANKVKTNAIPFDKAFLLPGYSLPLLYHLKYVPTDLSIEQLKDKYYISDIVKEIYKSQDFSKELRQKINH